MGLREGLSVIPGCTGFENSDISDSDGFFFSFFLTRGLFLNKGDVVNSFPPRLFQGNCRFSTVALFCQSMAI